MEEYYSEERKMRRIMFYQEERGISLISRWDNRHYKRGGTITF